MTFEELEAKVAELRREAALMLTDLDDSLAIVERLKDDGGVVVEMEAPQDQEGKVTHLPECWFYDPAKTPAVAVNDGWPCICDRLRACEQRVLDAAEQAVAEALKERMLMADCSPNTMRGPLLAIRALKEKPLSTN